MFKTLKTTRLIRCAGLLLLVLLLALPLFLQANAETYSHTVYSGAVYDVNVGDELDLYYSQSNSGMTFFDYYWDIDGKGIMLDDRGRSATITATAPGTVRATATLFGSYPVTNYGQRYNSVTKRWEKYTYTTSRSQKYTCTVIINIRDTLAPEVVAQPANASAAKGKTASTTFTVSDHSSVSYQWYYADPGSQEWKMSSITGDTYSCKMTADKSGRAVCCIATDANGNSTTSEIAYLGTLGITTQPKDNTVAIGKTAKATVKAYGDGLKYQWYVKDSGSKKFVKSSVKTATYATEMTAAKSGRQIYCVITDKYGISVQSKTVTLMQEFYATITKQPANAIAASGKVVSTSVTATGDGLKYQWYMKTATGSKFYKSSIIDSTYACKMNEANSGRQVYCVVTDKYGNSVKTKTVTLSMLSITQQPVNNDAAAGKLVSATVKASGLGLKYQWYVKDPGSNTFVKSSNKTATYAFNISAAKSGRQVYCVVTDKFGNSIKSDVATLRTTVTLKITQQPASVMKAPGVTASATVKVSGYEKLTYQWYVKDPGSKTFTKSSLTSSTYSVKMTAEKSGRQVYCVVTDTYGNSVKTQTATLTTAQPLSITAQPVSTKVQLDRKAVVTVEATGEGKLHYQWYIKDVGSSKFAKSSVTTATYAVPMNETRDGRQVYCVITDDFGGKLTTETVTLAMHCVHCKGTTVCDECDGDGVAIYYSTTINYWYSTTCRSCTTKGVCVYCMDD